MHETGEYNLDGIKNCGFKQKYNNNKIYGIGTYFTNSFDEVVIYSCKFTFKYACIIIAKGPTNLPALIVYIKSLK